MIVGDLMGRGLLCDGNCNRGVTADVRTSEQTKY